MSGFRDRERAFETKFELEQTHEFEISMRRNQLIGLWMATKLGLEGRDAELYVDEVIKADFERPGPEDVIEKLMRDVAHNDLNISEAQIRRKMLFFQERAFEKVGNKR